jgi:hypothetical protein
VRWAEAEAEAILIQRVRRSSVDEGRGNKARDRARRKQRFPGNEQRRERAIRRILELAFLNHHVRNALTQMSMVSYIADPEKQERLLQDAASRVSEVLFRIANSADLTGLSLEVDLAGVELAHEGEAREQGEVKKAS